MGVSVFRRLLLRYTEVRPTVSATDRMDGCRGGNEGKSTIRCLPARENVLRKMEMMRNPQREMYGASVQLKHDNIRPGRRFPAHRRL
jgi:hypothetical protein